MTTVDSVKLAAVEKDLRQALQALSDIAVRHNVALCCAVGIAGSMNGQIVARPFGKVVKAGTSDAGEGAARFVYAVNSLAALNVLDALGVAAKEDMPELARDLRKLANRHLPRLRGVQRQPS